MANVAKKNTNELDANPDPLTGAPGSHPVGTGVGAALAGAAAGAAGGALGGPIGVVAGAVIGGVAGGYVGKEVAENIDPTQEDAYWQSNYQSRPYVDQGTDYESYRPAYRYGWESRSKYRGRGFDEVETDLERDWQNSRGQSNIGWDKARPAARDAWDRVERTIPSDASHK
ncbi:MAG: hypothetical protein WD872_00180 [Pirellulaceae bacterium]